MSLYDSLGTAPLQFRQQAMQQLKANPAVILKQAGLNIPDGMTDPQQMVTYLYRSGQIGRNMRRVK